MGLSRRNAIRGALAAGVAGLAGCGRRAEKPDLAPGFLPPEQIVGVFEDGSRHRLMVGEWGTATTKAGGTLHMPTGRLIAADPAWIEDMDFTQVRPYAVTVPAGSYPVTLAVMSWQGDSRVAAVRLTVRKEPVRSWEMALLPGQDLSALAPGEAYTVGVDTATMALLDAAILTEMSRRIGSDPESFEPRAADQPIEMPGISSGGNLIAFGTGLGDGGYPVWIGRTATETVGCFMVDMAMLA